MTDVLNNTQMASSAWISNKLRKRRNAPSSMSCFNDRRKLRRGRKVLRRQIQGGRPVPAGASRAERLDPFTLPIRFAVSDTAADQRVRIVELTRERVVETSTPDVPFRVVAGPDIG